MSTIQYPVWFARCKNYNQALPETIHNLISTGAFPAPEQVKGKLALIKPNMLTDRTPDQAVTTHPELVRQIIRYLKEAAANIMVGDSPASTANLPKVWRDTGIQQVCHEEGVELISLEQGGSQSFNINGFKFAIANPVLKADLIINLPKVKSHSLTILTAAVKNAYGTIPGYSKTTLHGDYPKPSEFGRLVKTIWQSLPPTWSLADGIIGMEGQGPANGTPVHLGFLAASHNPFALDRALCTILRINPKRVPYLAAEGNTPTEFEILGDTISVSSFSVPAGGHLLNIVPSWLTRRANSLIWVRPAFSAESCIRCSLCVRACPVHALTLNSNDAVPQLEPLKCISCSCCHEVCPHDAIRMSQSAVLRLARVFKGLS